MFCTLECFFRLGAYQESASRRKPAFSFHLSARHPAEPSIKRCDDFGACVARATGLRGRLAGESTAWTVKADRIWLRLCSYVGQVVNRPIANRPMFLAAWSRWQADSPPHTGLTVDSPEACPTERPGFSTVPHNWSLAPILLIAHGLLSWPGFLQRHILPEVAWRFAHVEIRGALRLIPEDTFLRQRLYEYPQARMLEELTPPGAKILTPTNTAEAYTTREVLVSFQSAFNESAWDLIRVATEPGEAPTHRAVFRFPARAMNRIRIVHQGGSINEVHSAARGNRFTASPNPWDAHLAFDGNPATRWRPWQPPAPGMYLEADFDQPQFLGEVSVDSSDFLGARLEGVDAIPEEQTLTPPPLRRFAVEELKRRGIGYLMLPFDLDPQAWGIAEIGHVNGVRLYRL